MNNEEAIRKILEEKENGEITFLLIGPKHDKGQPQYKVMYKIRNETKVATITDMELLKCK